MRITRVAAVLLAFAASSSFALEPQAPGNSGQQPTGLGGRIKNPQNDRPRQEEKKPQPPQQQQQSGDSRDKKQDRRERDDR
ncbi:hypothetical protein [Tahibacter harae]|uniref:Uncharacterized protein n=1 Tax=Tahibacter harae TaxID=2963937 RepID=A0ABT1QNR6_9GAMM|nr:hypothetical protein [Tahibacter harae]MCQ4163172.1 hypothetical protein [Tahibacter harae]